MGVLDGNCARRVYLDYAATTPLDERAFDAMLPYLRESFGNASALYHEGREARDAVNSARRVVAGILDCADPFDITFTSGGTESDNTAINGIALAARAKMKSDAGCGHIICSSFEHHAVLDAVSHMKQHGFEFSTVNPRQDGIVYPEDLERLMRPDTVLVSIMAANNEIGTIQPIRELAKVAHAHGAHFHTDAVGAIGKMPFSIRDTEVDSLSVGGHKVYGPKGIGALYISKKAPFVPLVYGGGQEKGRRSGTYDTASIVGFARALELNVGADHDAELDRLMGLRDRIVAAVSEIPGIRTVVPIEAGDRSKVLASFVSLIFSEYESEDLVRMFDRKGFSISGGSACTSGSGKMSHVLASIGMKQSEASGFMRITLGKHVDDEAVDSFIEALCSL